MYLFGDFYSFFNHFWKILKCISIVSNFRFIDEAILLFWSTSATKNKWINETAEKITSLLNHSLRSELKK